ncbi:MAG: hypothetical protein AB8I08_32180 [Sandaracinaceae bacterium]
MTTSLRVSSAVCLIPVLLLVGCGGDEPMSDAGPMASVVPHFEPAADPMDFGAIPFPDDLYMDDEGHPMLGELPGEEAAFPGFSDATRSMLAELDGFSATAPVFFSLPPSSIDPGSLPATANASTAENASVVLLDADSASPTAFDRVPVLTAWDAERGLLAVRPYDGHPLVPGRRYAAVLTTSVLAMDGSPIGPHPRFQAIRDAETRPDEPVDAEVYDHYTPVLSSLASNGIARNRIAALAVFTVQTVAPELAAARRTVYTQATPSVSVVSIHPQGEALDALLGDPAEEQPGLDNEGGVAHSRIGALIQGRFESPWLLGTEPEVHGRFRSDGDDGLVVGRQEEVPFTLTLPTDGLDRVPVVVFQHGLGSERSTMLSVADALAGAGYATLAIDIPYHGMRASGTGVDGRHRYGETEGPDDFGDLTGQQVQLDYFAVVEERGDLPAFHPVYVRDALRQSVVDLMMAVRVVREGDWSSVTSEAGLEALAFSSDPIGFVGVSLGGIVGTVFLAAEPEIEAAALNVTGGDLTRLVEHSGSFSSVFLPLLLPKIGAPTVDGIPPSFLPEVAFVSTLLDRGDSMPAAALLRNQPVHLLLQMAEFDETVGNLSTEALARASGAPILERDPVHTDLMRVAGPLSENVELTEARVTRGLSVFAPANHGLLSRRMDSQRLAQPPLPPFESIEAEVVRNDVDGAVDQLTFFFESWRDGTPRIESPSL